MALIPEKLPGEWVFKKLLGPLLSEIGNDMVNLYTTGRDKIVQAASRKIKNIDDGKQPNLRVARDVFWNGSFTDEAICAEYFGGILASSRSEDGKNDNGIGYVDIIKSLSSKQLHLHYIIYNSLNKLLARERKWINIEEGSKLQKKLVWFSTAELRDTLKLNTETDLNILFTRNIINTYKYSSHTLETNDKFLYITVTPSLLGILLYAMAHNKFDIWDHFSTSNFGDFQDIVLPKFYAESLDELIKSVKTA